MEWLKMSLIAPFGLIFLAIIGIVAYILVPPEFSSIVAMLSALIFVLIVLAPISTIVSMLLGTIEVLKAGNLLTGGRKILWLVLFWVFLGYFGVALYYFTDRKKVIGKEMGAGDGMAETGG